MRFVTSHTCLSEPTTKVWMKIDPYYHQQKCSPGIAVFSKIRFMRIFAGVRWRGDVKWEWGRWKWRFSLISLAIFYEPHIQGHVNFYIVLCSPLVALDWHRNRWPWMTLNGHFASKCVSLRHLMDWRFGFRRNCSEICRATHVLSVSKIYPCIISVIGLFTGFLRRGSVKSVNCKLIHTHISHTCCSPMSVENK